MAPDYQIPAPGRPLKIFRQPGPMIFLPYMRGKCGPLDVPAYIVHHNEYKRESPAHLFQTVFSHRSSKMFIRFAHINHEQYRSRHIPVNAESETIANLH